MSSVDTPHFNIPFKLGPVGADVVEQDSIEDIRNSILMIVSTPLGWRDEVPEFGMDDPTLLRQPIGADQLGADIQAQEPRAMVLATERPDMYDELIDLVNIGVSTVRGE
jgi:hypothetical protein